jgi:SAM-dependent methyltransferase
MSVESADHWRRIYEIRSPTELSWYEALPQHSLDLVRATGLPLDASILDVGAGASLLVDHLLTAGYSDVTVLDIAPAAFAQTQSRLGPAATRVTWIAGDVLEFEPTRRYALWHDRAVLHFLTTAEKRSRYLRVLTAALAPRGHLILATFGPQGPTRCSGLPVQRYSEDQLRDLLPADFQLRRCLLENHRTPAGREQQFLWTWWETGS